MAYNKDDSSESDGSSEENADDVRERNQDALWERIRSVLKDCWDRRDSYGGIADPLDTGITQRNPWNTRDRVTGLCIITPPQKKMNFVKMFRNSNSSVSISHLRLK